MKEHSESRVKSLVMADLAHPPLEIGADVRKLPLHVTLVPPFHHERLATSHIARLIGEKLEDIRPFTITALHEEDLTANKKHETVRVRRVGAKTLYTVHNLLMSVVLGLPEEFKQEGLPEKFQQVDIDTKHTGVHYKPHATPTETQRLNIGETRHINALYLMQKVKLSNSHPMWYVAAKYPLGKDNETAS